LGKDLDTFWSSLVAGHNGIKRLPDNVSEAFSNNIYIAGQAVDFSLDEFNLNRKVKRDICNSELLTRMVVYTGLSALIDAGIEYPNETADIGSFLGTGTALAYRFDNEKFVDRNPKWFFETYPNIHLSHLCKAASLKGYGSTIVSACAGANLAIGQAFKMIQNGQIEIALAGGADDKLQPPFFSGFSRLNMCTASSDPETAMRPFDKDRNGFVIGQGACMMVLESFEHAQKRGAQPMARLVGHGGSMNAGSIADASHEGIVNSMKMALSDAKLSENDIDYINAHGSSTISNDNEESIAVKEMFGKRAYKIPINSTKSMIGHTFAACGAIEAAVCVKSLQEQTVHVTRNFKQSDLFCDLDYVSENSRKAKINYCMSNTSGIGGYNSTLIFGLP
ncbi:MAG TPA: beta-ketoacyl-[acyl-carrier-protein] synthase family protein, partial [Ruminiclostridium sp.]|nr:beta-ketoacyl-[acyl-carrier-protein] synthase family protein [Ruminiclostridium sp.]